MSIHAVDARVKTATLTGIVQDDAMSWPWASTCLCWVSDNFGSAHVRKMNHTSDTLGVVVTVRRAGSPILPFCGDDELAGDFQIRRMSDLGSTCAFIGAMRAGETGIDMIGNTASSDQLDIRFGSLVKGVGCYAQLAATSTYTARMRAYDSGGTLLLSVIKTGTSCEWPAAGCGFEDPELVWLGIAYDDADAANIARIDVNVSSATVSPLTDAAFNAAAEARFIMGSLVFGPFDPLAVISTPADPSPSRCFATSPGDGTAFSLSRGTARHGRVLAAFARDELLVSDGVETLGVHLRGVAWRVIGRGCTGLFYEADTDATVASFGTATYELEREGVLTDNGSGLTLTVETPGVASDASVPMRLQRLYVEADTRGQSVVPTLVLDETTIVLAAFVTARRTTVEYALDVSARVAGVRLNGAALADRVDVFGVDLDYYVPEGEPGATFTIPEAPMMVDA